MYTLHYSSYRLLHDGHFLPLWEVYQPTHSLVWVKLGIELPSENLTEILKKYTPADEPWATGRWLAAGKVDPNDFALWKSLKKGMSQLNVSEDSLSHVLTRHLIVRAPDGVQEVREVITVEKCELR